MSRRGGSESQATTEKKRRLDEADAVGSDVCAVPAIQMDTEYMHTVLVPWENNGSTTVTTAVWQYIGACFDLWCVNSFILYFDS
jgi:hypothetical protein